MDLAEPGDAAFERQALRARRHHDDGHTSARPSGGPDEQPMALVRRIELADHQSVRGVHTARATRRSRRHDTRPLTQINPKTT